MYKLTLALVLILVLSNNIFSQEGGSHYAEIVMQTEQMGGNTVDFYLTDYAGTVYCHDKINSYDWFEGKLRWKKPIEGNSESPMVCDVNNIVYIAVALDILKSKILAYNSNGELLWQTSALNGFPGDSPAMGFNILYHNTYRSNNFYAIK